MHFRRSCETHLDCLVAASVSGFVGSCLLVAWLHTVAIISLSCIEGVFRRPSIVAKDSMVAPVRLLYFRHDKLKLSGNEAMTKFRHPTKKGAISAFERSKELID